MKACSFFGHRDTPQTDELKHKVRETVERLIVEERVDTFLFGSRSKFDELCHIVVTELKEKHPYIQRIAYLCKHESGCFVGEGMKLKKQIKKLTGREVYVPEYEEIKKSDRVNSAGRACYVERNQWMLDESNYYIFYCDLDCQLSKRNFSKHFATDDQLKSGTKIIFNYAKLKSQTEKDVVIFNFYESE